MVQHCLQQVQDIMEKVPDTIDFLNASDARLKRFGSMMDPRLKMREVEIAFPKMFPSDLVGENIGTFKDIMYQLFDEYLRMYSSTCNVEESRECAFPMNAHRGDVTSSSLSELLQDAFSGKLLYLHLDEGCIFSQDVKFDAIT
ncbi:hypothetical protein V6N11_076969 [Hibiscus sabdariffa]|uniref:Uncharacterized protein n=1 Tax=Hibiscus sabdariffa TaxID=183260 RepID=A0ABR2TBN9_9ROSI